MVEMEILVDLDPILKREEDIIKITKITIKIIKEVAAGDSARTILIGRLEKMEGTQMREVPISRIKVVTIRIFLLVEVTIKIILVVGEPIRVDIKIIRIMVVHQDKVLAAMEQIGSSVDKNAQAGQCKIRTVLMVLMISLAPRRPFLCQRFTQA